MLLDRCVLEVRTTVIQCMVDTLRLWRKKSDSAQPLNFFKEKKESGSVDIKCQT